MHRRLAAFPLVLWAVLVAGCGSSSTAARPSQAVAATSAKTSASNAKVSLMGSVAAAGRSFAINGVGAFDFAQHRGTVNLSAGRGGAIENRIIGSVIYEKLPARLTVRTGGKQWLKIDLNTAANARGGSGQLGSLSQSSDPTQVLKYLRGAGGPVTTVGTEDVRGTKTTHYRTQVDLQKAVQQGAFAKGAVDTFTKQFGASTFPVDVWIDGQGRAARTRYSLKPLSGVGSFTFTQELYDFGKANVGVVPAPPADQTADISQLAQAAAGTRGG